MARAVGVVLNSYRGIAPIIIIEIDIVVSKMGCLFRAQFSLDVKIPLLRLLFPASAQTHSAENGGKDGCKGVSYCSVWVEISAYSAAEVAVRRDFDAVLKSTPLIQIRNYVCDLQLLICAR